MKYAEGETRTRTSIAGQRILSSLSLSRTRIVASARIPAPPHNDPAQDVHGRWQVVSGRQQIPQITVVKTVVKRGYRRNAGLETLVYRLLASLGWLAASNSGQLEPVPA